MNIYPNTKATSAHRRSPETDEFRDPLRVFSSKPGHLSKAFPYRKAMKRDDVITRLEIELLPRLQGQRQRLREETRFDSAEVTALLHPDGIYEIGMVCHPSWSAEAGENLIFRTTLCDRKWISAQAELLWLRTFKKGLSDGYIKKEHPGLFRKIESESDLAAFLKKWKTLSRRFDKVTKRGRPTARFLRFLRGAPRDFYTSSK